MARRGPEGLAALGFLPAAANEAPIEQTDALIMRGILKVYLDDLAGPSRTSAWRRPGSVPAALDLSGRVWLISVTPASAGRLDAAVTYAS